MKCGIKLFIVQKIPERTTSESAECSIKYNESMLKET